MTTDYNNIGELYQEAKKQPWRDRIESHSLMSLLGDLNGKKVVDVACGEGHFTRKLRRAGASRVVGVDISERMIALASQQESADPLGVEYRVEDAAADGPLGDFDLAVSAWLLVYAHSRAELAAMCRGLARRLAPGGRFVTLTTNPNLYHFDVPDYRRYGFEICLEPDVREGASILWRIFLGGASLEIENYYLPIEAYETALRDAGFREVAFHPPVLSPEGEAAEGRDHWAAMLDTSPMILIDAIRA